MRRAALALALALPPLAAAGDFGRGAAGTAGSEFLLLDAGARGVALAGAMSAVSDDAFSLYWNPAGLTHVPRLSASLMHAEYVAGISYDDLAYAQRVDDNSVLAGGLRYFDAGSIDQTGVNAASLGTFRPRSYSAELGWGEHIDDLSDREADVSLGVTGRYLHSEIAGTAANGYAGDLGLQARIYAAVLPYDVGLVAQNLGQGQKFSQTRDTLPTRLRAGVAAHPLADLTLSVEAVAPINDRPYGALGAEYVLDFQSAGKLALRAGFSSETYDSLGLGSTFGGGLGFKLGDFQFDYAFVPMGVLGEQTHRVSVTWSPPARPSRAAYYDR